MDMQRMSNYFFSSSSFVSCVIPTLFYFGSFMSRKHFNRLWWCICHVFSDSRNLRINVVVVNSRFIQGSTFHGFCGYLTLNT